MAIYVCKCRKCGGNVSIPDSRIDIISGTNKLIITDKFAACIECAELYKKGDSLYIKSVKTNDNKYLVINPVNTAIGDNASKINYGSK